MRTLTAALLLATLSFVAQAADIPKQDAKGLKDPPGLPRFADSALFINEAVDYDEIKVPAAPVKYADDSQSTLAAGKYAEASGQRWRMMYAIPDGRSPIEVVRNYQQLLKAKGYTAVFECAGDACGVGTGDYSGGSGDSFLNFLYPRSEYAKWADNNPASCAGGSGITELRYAVLQNEQSGELVAIATHRPGIVSVYCPEEEWKKHLFATVVHVRPKAMETNMVTIGSSDMSKTLTDTGRVALYGILFDTNKTELKTESLATIAEIAKLLAAEPKRRLIVVGHTDAVGNFDGNRDLSQRRAQAVVAALVSKHKVDAKRLLAFGASFSSPTASNEDEAGRAKNRRVELVSF